jgi:two-component system cell cycle sensor histidine kinase/response regulator CckA
MLKTPQAHPSNALRRVMPGLKPRELIRIALEMYPGMIVLLVTGYAEENLFPNGNSEGFHFIQKPFTPFELARRLEAILGEYAS